MKTFLLLTALLTSNLSFARTITCKTHDRRIFAKVEHDFKLKEAKVTYYHGIGIEIVPIEAKYGLEVRGASHFRNVYAKKFDYKSGEFHELIIYFDGKYSNDQYHDNNGIFYSRKNKEMIPLSCQGPQVLFQ